MQAIPQRLYAHGCDDNRGRLRTVLIFAYECAPYNKPESTIGAQRPAQFAKYLPEFGWRAIVLCCDASKRDRGWLPNERDEIAALFKREDSRSQIVATPSLASDGMLDRAWRATRSATMPGTTIARKALTFARFFTGDYSRSWHPCARDAARLIAEQIPVDACIGEHSPDAGIFLARWFSKTYHVPWIADFRDPMLFGFPPRARPLLEPFARRMLASASRIVNVTPHFVRLDTELFTPPTMLITNGFDPEQFAAPVPPRSRDEFRIVYTGNVWLPESLRLFCNGVSELRRRIGAARFKRFRFVYRGVARNLVESTARQAGVLDALDCAGHIDHSASLALIRSAHLVLLLSTSEVQHRDPYWAQGVYPGKAFEYLGSRRPILCVPGDGASLDQLLRDTHAGVSIGSTEEIVEFISRAYHTWERDGDVPSCDNQVAVEQFSRRVGAGQLARALNAIATRQQGAFLTTVRSTNTSRAVRR
jgi:glycosyltransferase involved in cell wall biosynthesis